MYCERCGAQLAEDGLFCERCGAPVGATVEDGVATTKLNESAYETPLAGFDPPPVAQSMPTTEMPPVATQPVVQQYGQPKKSHTGAIVAAVVAVVLVACVVLGVLFAPKWFNGDKYTVMFETSGGSVVGEVNVEKGQSITSPQDPVRDGYKFDGWYLDAAFIEKADFPLEPDESMTLYAKWTEKPGASDSGNGGSQPGFDTNSSSDSGIDMESSSEEYQQEYTPPAYDPVRDVYSTWVFEDSDVRRLTEAEVEGLSVENLCIALNEMFARYNYRFGSDTLREYFENRGFSLYNTSETIYDDTFDSVEWANYKLIKRIAKKKHSPYLPPNKVVLPDYMLDPPE